ncbi:hypothetical protein TTHERM_01165210 (macronuclear) [Tetrahymena thermophila SB210]|uniref:Transmembrane protein n=1 Tax=Tetrahymena thermophila (strain SB210) TaxID=312017 RepID=Q24FK5_TETTS|nr:hypothetical protein TTHERM_01165210 [Tetrahymena thermophila SB210]EAS06545.1 hypothetical protein TTHERM_01165210 [Tetrahymena thermophila SB210]|eukprot:XP_001026790.1 hypothetical protein TTHERM_01165210 [Tetrahymena thermophila SB210]
MGFHRANISFRSFTLFICLLLENDVFMLIQNIIQIEDNIYKLLNSINKQRIGDLNGVLLQNLNFAKQYGLKLLNLQKLFKIRKLLVQNPSSSVGRAPAFQAGGRGFEPLGG